jgi:bloom syndrome protein
VSKRRRAHVIEEEDDEEDDRTLHANGYERDGFVTSDNSEEESDDAFEPVRTIGIKRNANSRELGPPITTDLTMDSLSPNHSMVVEDFLQYAKMKCNEIRDKNSLRSVPFTDTILREMAIRFPRTQTELLRIPNINPEMVKRYSGPFLELIKKSKLFYQSLDTTVIQEENVSRNGKNQGKEENESEAEDIPIDPNHKNVIIVSSDDEGEDEFDDLLSDDETGGTKKRVNSSYFLGENTPAVEEFNQRWSLTQQQEAESVPKLEASSSKPLYGRAGGDLNSQFSRRGFRSYNEGRDGRMEMGTSRKQSTNSTNFTSKTVAGKRGRDGGAIGMMPT